MANDELESQAPDGVARAIRWLRDPMGKGVRLPLRLLPMAQDFAPLQRPVANATFWLERKWVAFRKRRHDRKRRQ